jgi:ABC-type transport system substrate-binding protein
VVDAGAASYNPNSRRIAEMIQNDWSKVGIKAKIVTYEWGEYLAGMRKGEHDSALFGWMSDNGDPDNFANTLLSCDNIKTGSNVARWCDKSYDALVKQAILVSDPQARAKLYAQAQEIFISRPLDHFGDRQDLLRNAQQRQRLQREPDGQRFFQS